MIFKPDNHRSSSPDLQQAFRPWAGLQLCFGSEMEALFYAFTLGLTVSILVAAVILRKPPKV